MPSLFPEKKSGGFLTQFVVFLSQGSLICCFLGAEKMKKNFTHPKYVQGLCFPVYAPSPNSFPGWLWLRGATTSHGLFSCFHQGLRALLSTAREFSQREKLLSTPFPNQLCHQPPPAFPH